MKCEARIVRKFKTAKAEVRWPAGAGFPENMKFPRCNGDVKITVKVASEPYYGGSDYRLSLEIECSRCRAPYVKRFEKTRRAIELAGELDVTSLFGNNGDK